MHDIGIAAKYVNREMNKAGLADILGYEGIQNIQGEEQAKLDVFPITTLSMHSNMVHSVVPWFLKRLRI
jgi:fructose-1,6-bisphosphatase